MCLLKSYYCCSFNGDKLFLLMIKIKACDYLKAATQYRYATLVDKHVNTKSISGI